jgi:hypothetical protein
MPYKNGKKMPYGKKATAKKPVKVMKKKKPMGKK